MKKVFMKDEKLESKRRRRSLPKRFADVRIVDLGTVGSRRLKPRKLFECRALIRHRHSTIVNIFRFLLLRSRRVRMRVMPYKCTCCKVETRIALKTM